MATVVSTDAVLSPLLGDCLVLSEPGALVRGGVIDLALGCLRVEGPTSVPIDVVLIRSTDHGASWKPVSRLLDRDDAVALGAVGAYGPQLNAADLFQIGASTYLFVTPERSGGKSRRDVLRLPGLPCHPLR